LDDVREVALARSSNRATRSSRPTTNTRTVVGVAAQSSSGMSGEGEKALMRTV